jgi:hypothetical protein
MHQLRRTTSLLAVPAVLLSFTLAGCGLAEDAAKKQAEDAAKSAGVDLSIGDDGQIGVDTTDGGVVTGKLPKAFPVDQVPVVDGDILAGTYTKNPNSWNVTIKVGPAGGDKAAAYSTAEDKLTSGGLDTVTPSSDNGTGIFGQYASSSWVVDLAVTDSNGIVVNYTVAPK